MFEGIDPGNFAIFNQPNTFSLAGFCNKRDRFVGKQEQICSLICKRRKEASVKMASDSSDSGSVDEILDLMTCSLCSKTLDEPRSLPCFHNFCKVCLGEYIFVV